MSTELAAIVQPGTHGIARIEHRCPDKLAVMRAAFRGQLLSQRTLTTLFVGSCMMMSDGDEEWRSNSRFMHRANGDVLIAGLGIGMVLTKVLPKPDVRTVTVIEKHADVIALVAPAFPDPKLKIVHADIFEWKPEKGQKWDTIYFDIWPDICTDNLPGMAMLHRKFARTLYRANPKCWMGSWQRDYLRAQKRRGY